MARDDVPLHIRLRDARRAKGLTQSALASQADCKQSAVSMMEQGNATALSSEKIRHIGRILGIETPELTEEVISPPAIPGRAYCPVYDCPTNRPFTVGERLLLLPKHATFHGSRATRCPMCGELLERACPECKTPIGPGACCEDCGTPYVTAPTELPIPLSQWAAEQLERIQSICT